MLLGRLLKIDSTFPDSGFQIPDSGFWFPGFRFTLVTSSPATRVTRLIWVLSPVTPKKYCTMAYHIPHYSGTALSNLLPNIVLLPGCCLRMPTNVSLAIFSFKLGHLFGT